jgi:hypothetical protein
MVGRELRHEWLPQGEGCRELLYGERKRHLKKKNKTKKKARQTRKIVPKTMTDEYFPFDDVGDMMLDDIKIDCVAFCYKKCISGRQSPKKKIGKRLLKSEGFKPVVVVR